MRNAMPERSKTRVGPSKFELQLDPGLSTGQAIKQIHLVLLQSMCSNEEGIRTNLDPEFLHNFRVAIRRTRAALTQIKYIYPDDITVHIRGEFAWLGQKTGPLRDLDVFLLRIEYFKTHLPKSMQQTLDPFYQFLHANQKVEHRRLLHTLESARYRQLLANWKEILKTPKILDNTGPNAGRSNRETGTTPYWKDFQTVLARSSQQSMAKRLINIHRPIGDVASERIWRVYRRVYKQGRSITDHTPAEALHRLRIECKKLRYFLEFFHSLYKPSEMKRLTRALKRLQDNLGDFNDYEVQQDKLKSFGADMKQQRLVPVETLMAISHLVDTLRHGQARERVRFQKCFAEFSKLKNRKRFRRLFK
ncbi:MAG TPA: hypothetical protein DIT99_10565, partial [Candidatus Latescibacteria bacterium]|nr:hypothetical protein [Candidatus Latescibacterota bacterium]